MKILSINLLFAFLLFFVGCSKKDESSVELDNPPTALTYNYNSLSLERFQPLNFIYPNIQGDNLKYKVEPSLPTGLKLNTRLGTISGIPQVAAPNQIYKITAYNSGGESSFDISIVVTTRSVPSISYTQNSYSLPLGQPIDIPIVLEKFGATFTGFTIDNPLPNGLVFNPTDGSVTGVPTVFIRDSLHTITGTTSTGSFVYAALLIQIMDYPPLDLIYKQNGVETTSFSQTINSEIVNIVPEYEGGVVESYSISPTLPNGLYFNQLTGVIYGTPLSMMLNTKYTITARNTGGVISKDIFIEVKNIPPVNLSYNQSTITLRKTIPIINQIIPTYNGGQITNFSISPLLPSGLIFNSTNGEISGTPTNVSNINVYTVTGINNGGSASTTFNLLVRDLPPQNLSYSIISEIYIKNTPISALNPRSDGGIVSAYTITPELPSGLILNTVTGQITGTPLSLSSITSYVVRAINSEGSTPYSFFLAVKDEAPANLKYSSTFFEYEKGTLISPMIPSNTKGGITSYTINIPLPSGLTLNQTTGQITGTPIVVSPETNYIITGKNATGETNTTITITVKDKPPLNLNYGSNNYLFDKGTPISDLIPSSTGGTIVNYRVKAGSLLPSGLILDTTTGIISGVPGVRVVSTHTIIEGYNSGGIIERRIDFSINDNPPLNITYGQEIINLTIGQDLGTEGLFPSNEGGSIDNYSIIPSLPLGLSFNQSTGAIMGFPINPNGGTISNPMGIGSTPNASPYSVAQEFTVYGINSGGQTSKIIKIRIVPPKPIISIPAILTIQKDSNFLGLFPSMSGGVATEFLIQPSNLPAGLTFNTSNGSITGIPIQVTSAQLYTIRAKNDGGDVSAQITIKITEVPPSNINYSLLTTDFIGDNYHYVDSVGSWVWGNETVATSMLNTINSNGYTYEKGEQFIANKFKIKRYYTGNNDYTILKFISDGILSYPQIKIIPTISGGPVVQWSIDKTLPNGFFFDNITGTIYGTPTTSSSPIDYLISATNDGGVTNKTIRLYIKDLPPTNLTYDSLSYEFGSSDQIIIPSPINTGGNIQTYSISPALPSQLNFSTTNGSILKDQGVAVASFSTRTYTVQGCNPEGCTTTTFDLKITTNKPEVVSYDDLTIEQDILYFTVGDTNSYTPTTKGGGLATAFEIEDIQQITPYNNFIADRLTTTIEDLDSIFLSGTIPNLINSLNLTFNPTTGTISGNPNYLNHSFYYFIIEGTNEHPESSNPTVTYIYINRKPIANAGSDYTGFIGSSFNLNGSLSSDPDSGIPWTLTNVTKGKELRYTWRLISKPTDSTLTSGSISNSSIVNPVFIPDKIGVYQFGLMINDGLSNSLVEDTVSITVNDVPPSNLNYAKQQLINRIIENNILYNLDSGESFTMYPSNDGGKIVSYSISPTLPVGLNFNTTTGIISGVPTIASPPTNYTITATNSGGSVNKVINIYVNQKPNALVTASSKLNIGSSLILNGSMSSDPDGQYFQSLPYGPQFFTYKWTIKSKPVGSSLNNGSFLPSNDVINPTLTPDIKGVYVITLVVSDGKLESVPYDFTFSVGIKPYNIQFTDVSAAYKDANHFAYNENQNVNITVSFSGDDTESLGLIMSVSNLPSGLNFSQSTKKITGSVVNSVLPRNISVNIENYGGVTVGNFELWINDIPSIELLQPLQTGLIANDTMFSSGISLLDTDYSVMNTVPYNVKTFSYNWDLIGVPSASSKQKSDIGNINSQYAFLDVDVEGIYLMQLIYNDGMADSLPKVQRAESSYLPLIDGNPVADVSLSYMQGTPSIKAGKAGILTYTPEVGNLILDAGNSSSNSGGLNYLWKAESKPSGSLSSFVNSNSSQVSVVLDKTGSYVFSLTVTDQSNSVSTRLLYVNHIANDIDKNYVPAEISYFEYITAEESPYYLDRDISIKTGGTLMVQAGATLYGNGHSISLEGGKLWLNGTSNAQANLNNLSIIGVSGSPSYINSYYGYLKDVAICQKTPTSVPCNGDILFQNGVFLDLKGDQRLEGIVNVTNNIFINSNGFTVTSNNSLKMDFNENYVYNSQGGYESDSSKFFINVLTNTNQKINIIKNRFVNPNNYTIIKHNNVSSEKLNLRYNYWGNNFDLDQINSKVINNSNTFITPFFTNPGSYIKDGRSFY